MDVVFTRLDPLVKEALELKVDATNRERFFFLLANIMWYLGNVVPLQAGSAAATENFINAILVAKGFSVEKFRLVDDIPWYFSVKLTPRLEFVKKFPAVFEEIPQVRVDVEHQRAARL